MKARWVTCLFCIAAMNAWGQVLDPAFKPAFVAGDRITETALLPDGKILAAGTIAAYATAGNASGKLARINPNGSFDPAFNAGTGVNGAIYSIAVQSDNKLILGGYFTNYNGTAANNLVRINSDGTVDPTFNIGSGIVGNSNFISKIIIGDDAKIYIAGVLTSFNGEPCNMVVRLNADGTRDNTFLMPATHVGEVAAMVLQPDGKIIIGGEVRRVNSVGLPSVVIRLSTNGTLDPDFLISSSTLHQVYSLDIQTDGKILVGGDFTSYNAAPYKYLVRLAQDGSIDPTFKHDLKSLHSGIGPYGTMTDIKVQQDGRIVVAGNLYAYGNTVLNDVARLNSDGSLENSFAACEHRGGIDKVQIQSDGNIFLAGSLYNFNGVSTNNALVRILGNPVIPPPPASDFDFVTLGREVSFINQSVGAVSYEWNFGDGTYSTLSNPVHTYGYSGNLNVRLTALGYCGVEVTKSKTVAILDLQRVTPANAANKGVLAIQVIGNGLLPNATVTLIKGKRIQATYVNATADGKQLIASFNLNDEAVGTYEVEVKQGSTTRRLRDAIALEAADETIDLDVEIFGRPNLRRGIAQKYEVKVSNNSNRTIRGVPCFITVPKNTTVSFENYIMQEDVGEIYFSTNDLFGTVGDSVDVYSFLIPAILPHNNKIISALITSQGDQVNLQAWAYPALYNSPRNPNFTDCLDQAGKAAVTPDLATCFFSAQNFGESTLSDDQVFALVSNEKELDKPGGITRLENALVSFFRRATKVVMDCSGATSPPINILKKDGFVMALMKGAMKGFLTLAECASSLPRPFIKELKIRVVASNDPNEKVGISGTTSENFITGDQQLDYSIYFENLASASAPAQEVVIIDTLDAEHLDLSSLIVKSFGFGALQPLRIPYGLTSYSTIIDMRPDRDIKVKVDAKLNTQSGILTWRFLSLDPLTNERIDDPLAGFLPPNLEAPYGEGFISYSVTAKAELTSGVEIRNKAFIFFDANAPIETNTFVNTIDKTKPVSGIKNLSQTEVDSIYTITWSGTDGLSGIQSYDLYYAINNGSFRLWKFDLTGEQTKLSIKRDSLYGFYSIAKDRVGNFENAKHAAEATTQLITAVEDWRDKAHFICYPNPFQRNVSISFFQRNSSVVKIAFKNLQGQEIVHMPDAVYAPGKHTVIINTAQLATGIYLCELIQGNDQYISKLIKL